MFTFKVDFVKVLDQIFSSGCLQLSSSKRLALAGATGIGGGRRRGNLLDQVCSRVGLLLSFGKVIHSAGNAGPQPAALCWHFHVS